MQYRAVEHYLRWENLSFGQQECIEQALLKDLKGEFEAFEIEHGLYLIHEGIPVLVGDPFEH